MATYDLVRNAEFTSNTADYDLLASSTAVRNILKQRFGITADADLDTMISNGIKNMQFDIFMSGSTVKINDEEFELIDDSVYTTGDFIRKPITSIQITEDAITGVISLNVL